MEIVQKPRASGKTFEIVQRFRAHTGDARLVVASAIERDRIVRLYELEPDEARRVIVAGQDRLRGHHGEVFCDNLDWIISLFLGEAVDVATVNASALPEAPHE